MAEIAVVKVGIAEIAALPVQHGRRSSFRRATSLGYLERGSVLELTAALPGSRQKSIL